MIPVSVIPQRLCYAGIGRSSDFVLLAARLPGIRIFQWIIPIYIIYTRCMHCPKNGLTASGNVADSHCIPILALGSHNPQEPNAGTKIRISERNAKFIWAFPSVSILETKFQSTNKRTIFQICEQERAEKVYFLCRT